MYDKRSFWRNGRVSVVRGLFLVGVVYLLALAGPAAAVTVITVNSDADATANDGSCTMREAIIASNTDTVSGVMAGECAAGDGSPDTIDFSGDLIIVPGTPLPDILDPVFIDGTAHIVTLDGASAGTGAGADGLTIWAGGSTVQGLIIVGFDQSGLRIETPSNVIGGTIAGQGNVISNNNIGVHLIGAAAAGNMVLGNLIGTDASGNDPLGNTLHGVLLNSAPSNTIGYNVISDSGSNGVLILNPGSASNTVTGNYIGTNEAGDAALGNGTSGVKIQNSPANTIGGTTAADRNVISGNGQHGVEITTAGATANDVIGNYIGTNAAGDTALGNTLSGVNISGPAVNTIGGTTADKRNVISGNGQNGVRIGNGATGNMVHTNYIGTDVTGTADLGNSFNGVLITDGAFGNSIGSTAADEGNTIAFNAQDGVAVIGAPTINNTIRGNSIHDNVQQGIDNSSGGNTELTPPTVTSASSAAGKACKGCIVDVYSDADGQGQVYEGTTVAAAGSGRWSFADPVSGPNVTATATDAAGNTSEFSIPFGPVIPCSVTWPVTTVNTIAKGQSAANNAKLSHAITGHIVEPGALGPNASRIRICEGTTVSIDITDSFGPGTPSLAPLTPNIACNFVFGPTPDCVTAPLTATAKYQAVSIDGKDTDRLTLLP